eukprot:8252198-Pyramimonas_sp.AAC.1
MDQSRGARGHIPRVGTNGAEGGGMYPAATSVGPSASSVWVGSSDAFADSLRWNRAHDTRRTDRTIG